MKSIIVAEDQGFCWGVRRALDIVNRYPKVLILGDLIHNKQVVAQLETDGKKVIHQVHGDEAHPIVITAHGTDLENIHQIKQLGLHLIDTTCPLVSLIYRAGEKLEADGYRILILGDHTHVEVTGIASRLKNPLIVNNDEELAAANLPSKIGVICQSTFSQTKFDRLVLQVRNRADDVAVRNTICPPTRKRQLAAEKLAKQVEVMVVVGGFHSSNTKKLVELTQQYVVSYHVETADHLKPEWFHGKTDIGITSGASTADWIVEQICDRIRHFN
jgi:(E)-4-hydroxy-3-methyl-but-2-enyl pyrophosphate reductase